MTTDAQLWRTARVLYDKGEKSFAKGNDFFISLGEVLKKLKGDKSQREFLALTQEHLGVGKSKAYQLIAIADGKTTVERVREGYAKADAKRRVPAKSVHGHGQQPDQAPTGRALTVVEQEDDRDNDRDGDQNIVVVFNEIISQLTAAATPDGDQDDGDTPKKNYLAGSGNVDWYTPAKYIELARKVLDEIDLDPASCAKAQEVVKAGRYFTEQQNGLEQPWSGRVWLNPPYSKELMAPFVFKLLAEVKAGNVTSALVLTNNGTCTRWFHDLAAAAALACFIKGRIRFCTPDGDIAPDTAQGQVIFYIGADADRFRDVFEGEGIVAALCDSTPQATDDRTAGAKLYDLQRLNLALTSEIGDLQKEVSDLRGQLAQALEKIAKQSSLPKPVAPQTSVHCKVVSAAGAAPMMSVPVTVLQTTEAAPMMSVKAPPIAVDLDDIPDFLDRTTSRQTA